MHAGHPELLFDKRDQIATITLNRPEKLNALTNKMIDGITELAREVEEDNDVRVLVLAAAGDAFSVGLDLRNAGRRNPRTGYPEARWRNWTLGHLFHMAKPTIAAVNGMAAGGGFSFALECDIRIASEKARFTCVYSKTALPVIDGMAVLLPAAIGTSKALELLYTSRIVGGEEAERLGIVSRIVAHDELMDQVMGLAGEIAAGPPVAHRLTKDVVTAPLRRDYADHLPHQLYAMHVNRALAGHDIEEGVQAFKERRRPTFRGLKPPEEG